MDKSTGLHERVELEVRALLRRAPAYRELSDATRAQVAADTTKIAESLADKGWLTHSEGHAGAGAAPVPDALRELLEEVDFPAFVASLVKGVFGAIVDASIQQMQAYAELVASISKQLDDFTEDKDEHGHARAAAGTLARQRQQQLATMVLMGINRIVVTSRRRSKS